MLLVPEVVETEVSVVVLTVLAVLVLLAVQKLHVLSQAPVYLHVGQNSVSQVLHCWRPGPHTFAQKAAPIPSVGLQEVSVVLDSVVVSVVTEVVEIVEVVSVSVTWVIDVVESETVVRVPVDSVLVSVVVEFSWQKPHVKSHVRAAGQVGQKVTSQSSAISMHTSMQSSSLKQVVVVPEVE